MDTKTGIPLETLIDMADILYRGVQEAVKDAEFMKAYEEWRKEQKQRKDAKI